MLENEKGSRAQTAKEVSTIRLACETRLQERRGKQEHSL